MKKLPGKSWTIAPEEADLRLDKWLAAADRLVSRSRALEAIAKGKVFVNEQEMANKDAARKLAAGESVRLWMDRPGSAQRRYSERRDAGLHLLYEDPELLIVNKPAGLLTIPLAASPDEPSVLEGLRKHLRSHRKIEPLVVHRIDRDTSGLVVFAKTPAAQRALKDQFERQSVERVYLALVHGRPTPDAGLWRDQLEWDQQELKQQAARKRGPHAKEAACHYRVLESFAAASLLEVRLVTGKRNQIRIQAGLRGHPLLGERMYVYENAPAPRIPAPRQALHAHRLRFRHPASDREMTFEAPLPQDMETLLERLRPSRPQLDK